MSRRSSSPRRRGLVTLGILVGACLLAGWALVALFGSAAPVYVETGRLDALSAAKIAYVDGEYERAEELLRALGNDPEVLSLLGRVLLERGNVPKAQEVLSSLLKSDPENYDATRAMAEVYKRQGQLDFAIVYLTRATELRPTDSRAWRELGLAQREKGDAYGALTSLQQSLLLNEDQGDLSNLVTELAMGKGTRSEVPGFPGFGRPFAGGSREHGGSVPSAFQAAGRVPRPRLPNPAPGIHDHVAELPR